MLASHASEPPAIAMRIRAASRDVNASRPARSATTSSIDGRAFMTPDRLCGRPSAWPTSWATVRPIRWILSSVASAGIDRPFVPDRSELVNAVLDCAKGRDVVAPSLAAGLAGEIRKRAEPEGPTLSPREREVLKLIAAGSSIPAMAKELFLAPSTVKTHVQRLYEKLGVSDRAAAVAEAMRRKLLE